MDSSNDLFSMGADEPERSKPTEAKSGRVGKTAPKIAPKNASNNAGKITDKNKH